MAGLPLSLPHPGLSSRVLWAPQWQEVSVYLRKMGKSIESKPVIINFLQSEQECTKQDCLASEESRIGPGEEQPHGA